MTTTTVLPTVNFDSNPGLDEFQFLHNTYSEEFRWRTQIGSQYGIVDTANPALAPFTAGRPLLVSVNPIHSLQLDIAQGFGVTPSGCLINIDAPISGLPIPSIAGGNIYVVLAEYVLIPSTQTRINRAGDLVEVRLERPSSTPVGNNTASTLANSITVVNYLDFINPAIFDQQRLDNLLSLAVVSVLNDTLGNLYTTIDLTTTYSFNRPWFYFKDIEHRSKVGNGAQTDKNVHGVAIGDLTTEGLTIYEQINPLGGVFAQDVSYYGYAGHICTELITLGRIETDLTGEVSGDLGGRYYVRLTKLPVRTGSLYIQGKPWQPIPYEWIEGTAIILLGQYEDPSSYSDNLTMEYFNVTALEPNEDTLLSGIQTLTVGTPASDAEYIVANGLSFSLNGLSQTSVDLPSTLGPIKRQYQAFCTGSGLLMLSPQPLVASMRVSDLTSTPQTVNQAPYAGTGVTLTLGLTGSQKRSIKGQSTYDLNLQLLLTGVDYIGAQIQETLIFGASTWRDQVRGVEQEEPMQFVTTLNKFQLLTSIAIANTTNNPSNVGQLATISVWANILNGISAQEFASVASFFWTGDQGGIRVKDERRIATALTPDTQRQWRRAVGNDLAAVQDLFSVLLSPPLTKQTPTQQVLVELDDDRQFGETWSQFSTARTTGLIQYINALQYPYGVGSTIRIATGKYLTFVDTTTADSSKGEVAWSTTPAVLASNLALAINNPIWESSWVAVVGSESVPSVSLSRELAYPEGFVQCQRVEFSVTLVTGLDLTIILNGTPSTATYIADPLALLANFVAAINANKVTHGITAVSHFTAASQYPTIILNGKPDGQDFTIAGADAVTYSSSQLTTEITILLYHNVNNPVINAPTATLSYPLAAFTLTQPTGGSLPTPHLPVRYPSYAEQWTYLTRPLLWGKLYWLAKISLDSNSIANIGDGDTIAIAPFKYVTARKTSVPDPTKGEFPVAVDAQTTLQNLTDTINNATFNCGLRAVLTQDPATSYWQVELTSEGKASTVLQMTVKRNSVSWVLTDWMPQGSTDVYAFLRAIYPLAEAKWRVKIVNLDGTISDWSLWLDLDRISANSFSFSNNDIDNGMLFSFYGDDDPRAAGFSDTFTPRDGGIWSYNGIAAPPPSIYTLQLQLKGEVGSGKPNGFSVYRYEPEISDSTNTLPARMTVVEKDIADATGTTASLDARISVAVSSSGFLVQDPELTGARTSSVTGLTSSLREHLDGIDTLLHIASQGAGATANFASLSPVVGGPNAIVSGPNSQGISQFLNAVGKKLSIIGTSADPLVLQINGRTYFTYSIIDIDFTGKTAGTYYVYADVSAPFGNLILYTQQSASVVKNGHTFTDTDGSFSTNKVMAGHLLVIDSILMDNGLPLVTPIVGVTSHTLTVLGSFPVTQAGLTYHIYSPREVSYQVESVLSPDTATRLHIGQTQWSGTAFNLYSTRNYRYNSTYISPITAVPVSGGNYQLTFDHDLGHMPNGFTIYFYANNTDSVGKVLNIGDEAVVQADTVTLQVRNRYANLIARSFSGDNQTTGFLQLVAF